MPIPGEWSFDLRLHEHWLISCRVIYLSFRRLNIVLNIAKRQSGKQKKMAALRHPTVPKWEKSVVDRQTFYRPYRQHQTFKLRYEIEYIRSSSSRVLLRGIEMKGISVSTITRGHDYFDVHAISIFSSLSLSPAPLFFFIFFLFFW